MKRIHCSSNRIAYRQPIGWGAIIGIPVFVAVLTVTVGTIVARQMLQSGWAWAAVLALLVVSALAIKAAFDLLSRIGVDIDLSRNTVVTTWGVLFPFWSTTHRLESYKAVFLTSRTRGKFSDYVIAMQRGEELDYVAVEETLARLCRLGEEIARFVRLPLVDLTDGTPRVVDVWASLSKQSIRQTAAPEIPPLLAKQRLRVQRDGHKITLRLPIGDCGFFGLWIILFAGYVAFVYFLGLKSNFNPWVLGIWGSILGLLILVLFFVMKPRRDSIEIDLDGLTIRRQGFVFSTGERLAWRSIREIKHVERSVQIRTDDWDRRVGVTQMTQADSIWVADYLTAYWQGKSA